MTRDAIKRTLRVLGIRQAELARATGLSEAAISRQLSGDLVLSEKVRREAEELLTRRAAEVGVRLLRWAQRCNTPRGNRNEQRSTSGERRAT